MRTKSIYWIPTNRRQELRYFTLQYYDYKRKIDEIRYLGNFISKGGIIAVNEQFIIKPSNVEKIALEATRYSEYVIQIDRVVKELNANLEDILRDAKKNVNSGQMTLFYWKLDKLHI